GAASGIGAATARIFVEARADLALAWYPPDRPDIGPVGQAVDGWAGKAVVAEVDVTKSADVDTLTARAVRELGGLHIVIASAGISRRRNLTDLDDAVLHLVL